jgi:hypothetical protein
MENIHLITIATHNEGYYNALKKSAKNNNYNLITLGWGKKWEGFIMKYKLLIEILNNYDDNDIIILIDAYDVIVTDSKSVVIEKFKKFKKPILLSKDGYTGNSIFNYIHDKIFDDYNGNHICAGLMMGYVWALRKLIFLMCGDELEKCKQLNLDDQILLINTCKKNKLINNFVAIDKNSEIFYNTYGNVNKLEFNFEITDIFDIKNNKLYLKSTNISPCFIHGPGNTNLNNLCNFYDLPISTKISRDYIYRLKTYIKPQYLVKFSDEINKIIIICLIYVLIVTGLYVRDNYYLKNK